MSLACLNGEREGDEYRGQWQQSVINSAPSLRICHSDISPPPLPHHCAQVV